MSALIINDLSVTEELNSNAMKAVRGGFLSDPFFQIMTFDFDSSKHVYAPQMIQQQMDINNVSGNNNAFASNIKTTILPTMMASNNVTVN